MEITGHELRQMYHDDQMSMRKIANKIGVSLSTISNWMKLYGIESRTNSESLLYNSVKPSKKDLMEMCNNDQMTQIEIAEVCGISQSTISRQISTLGIESHLINISKEKLHQMYHNESMMAYEIATKIGVSESTIFYWMKKYGIKSRTPTEVHSMENNGNWNGGTSFEPYCNKFNNIFKEAVRKRDDYTCQLCGYEQKLNGQRLSIHHIHYDKENCYPDVVALCCSCNSKVNVDRGYWEDFFETRLVVRGLLNWSISQET